jgi:hypothetical protein
MGNLGIPLDVDLPIVTAADCYTTNPKNILCAPEWLRGLRIPPVVLEIPIDLDNPSSCPGYIPPPPFFNLWYFVNPAVHGWNALMAVRDNAHFLVQLYFQMEIPYGRNSVYTAFVLRVLGFYDSRYNRINTRSLVCSRVVYLYSTLYWLWGAYTLAILLPGVSSALYVIAATWRNIYIGFRSRSSARLARFANEDYRLDPLRRRPAWYAAERLMLYRPDVNLPANARKRRALYTDPTAAGHANQEPANYHWNHTPSVVQLVSGNIDDDNHGAAAAAAPAAALPNLIAADLLEAVQYQSHARDRLRAWIHSSIAHFGHNPALRTDKDANAYCGGLFSSLPDLTYHDTLEYHADILHNVHVQLKLAPAESSRDIPLPYPTSVGA